MKKIKEKIIEILKNGEITQRELRENIGISKSYISEILNSMEKEGLIKRRRISERTVMVDLNRNLYMNVGILKSSEYAAVLLTAKDINEFNVKVLVYNNSLEELKDLLIEKIDIAFAPVATGLIFHLIDENIVVLNGCARGGSGIIYTEKDGAIGSTLLSTMDIISRKFSKSTKIRYFSSPEEMKDSYLRDELKGISIWEPYFSLINRGKKIYMEKNMLCCGLLTLSKKIDNKIKIFQKRFIENSMDLRNGKRKEEASLLISKTLGIDYDIILKSLESYIFDTEITFSDIENIMNSFEINAKNDTIKKFLLI
ncbi:MAG: winged helix-turn-helix transcriptional regulator [Thermoplasmata archaeon]